MSGIDAWNCEYELRTAFVLTIGLDVYICTAGHVLKDLIDDTTGKTRKGVRFDIEFFSPDNAIHRHSIDASKAGIHYEYDPGTGRDFGVLILHSSDIAALERKGCRVFGKAEWRKIDFEPNCYAVLGFPRNTRSASISKTETDVYIDLWQAHPLIPLEPLNDSPRDPARDPLFRGKPLGRVGSLDGKIVPVSDLNGMSGGPIWALRVEETCVEHCMLAIQVGEDEKAGTIEGCFIRHLVECLYGIDPRRR